MEPKQDYFRSPTPRNLENFYSPFRLLRHEEDPLINTLLSPLNRNASSYMSLLSPQQSHPEDSQQSAKRSKVGVMSKKLEFGPDEKEQQQLSEQEETPPKNLIKITNVDTTPRKKYDLRFIQSSEKPHYSRDGERGLRALSKQAYQIFQQDLSMTYQEVAQKIIEQNEQLNEYPEKKKQRQSIKRRVYDALNVLIAVGILEKSGKKISMSKRMIEENKKQTDTKKDLYEKLDGQIKILEAKRKRIQKIKQQKQCLAKLIARNSNSNKIQKNDHKIILPFVIAKNPCTIRNHNEATIHSFVCGDIDAIDKLNIDKKY